MNKITKVHSRQVFDSRGNPTIESEIYLEDGCKASAIVPSGASTGTHAAFELRDIENKKYLGKSVLGAVSKINGEISKELKGSFFIFFKPKSNIFLINIFLIPVALFKLVFIF